MKKYFKSLLCMLLCIIMLSGSFVACSTQTGPEAEPTTLETTSYAESVAAGEEAEVVVSDEVIDLAEDTAESIAAGENIETETTVDSEHADEEKIENEQAIEQDAMVEQENISYDGTNTGNGAKFLAGDPALTYYSQIDSRWKNKPYTIKNSSSQTIGSSGCGPTSAAMIVSSSKGIIKPDTMAKLFVDNGYRTRDNGTAWSAWAFVADYFDFDFYKSTSSFSTVEKYLETDKDNDGVSDYFVVTSCAAGLFTSGGHYITLMGDKNNTLTVYDPYYYYGKFSTPSRKAANVKVSGNIAYVTESAFKQYSKYKNFWIFSNDNKQKPKAEGTTKPNNNTTKTVSKYVSASVLNVRSGAGISNSIVKTLKYGTKVTVYETKDGWSRIGNKEWVSNKYLVDKISTKAETKTTIAYIYVPATGRSAYCKYSALEKYNVKWRLKANTVLYSKSNLTGTQYNYLAHTTVTLKKTL